MGIENLHFTRIISKPGNFRSKDGITFKDGDEHFLRNYTEQSKNAYTKVYDDGVGVFAAKGASVWKWMRPLPFRAQKLFFGLY